MAKHGGRVQVRVLGPLRVQDADGGDITPSGALQRRLLALLVLRRGQAVSLDGAIDALWPTDPPRDPAAAVHNHVSRLRQSLPEGALAWTGAGYLLEHEHVDVDADRLADAVAADAGDETAAAVVDEVLAHWSGSPYPELADVDDGLVEASRLEELRLRALEDRAARRLAARDTDGLVADLTALTAEAPLRERPRELLIEALAATGRLADALRAYDDFRRLLGEELGIEPSALLAARHAELLAGSAPGSWLPAHSLPSPPTRLLGRASLLDATVAALGEHRLVSLVGPGGVGKTRLSLEVGHRLRADRPDRPVVFCELATATPESAHDVVAAALAISPRAGVAALDRVVDALPGAEVVLVLDNCEHVLEPIAVLAERVLAACPESRLLATSRERLRITGEQLVAVPTLELGTEGSPAVELFLERARAVVPGFEPDAEAAAAIGEIVARLDGLPLAIELAASRLQTHDVAEVTAGLDRRFSLLSSGARTSSRHGSLSAAVAWSYGLLHPQLQRAFADLSVFAAAFTADDAAAVTGLGLDEARAALDQLVERSLVVRRRDRRYVLLETLRAFGTEQLDATARAGEVRERHADHQIDWIHAASGRLLDPGGRRLEEIDAGLPDLRAALTFLIERRDVVRAARLMAPLLDYGFLRLRPDVLAWTRRVIELQPDDDYPEASRVRALAAYAAWMGGDVAQMGALGERALELAEREGRLAPEVAAAWASHALFEGRLDDAFEWFERSVDVAAEAPSRRKLYMSSALLPLGYSGDPRTRSRVDAVLAELGDDRTPYGAYAWYCAGEAELASDPGRALPRFVRALELAEETGASFVLGVAGTSKASIEARFGDAEVAVADYRRILDQWRRAGMWSSQWTTLRSVAALLARLGRHHDAAVLVGAVSHTQAGHRIFGADEDALRELTQRLREALGDATLEAALAAGAVLDGDAAVEHARQAL